ncbi:MAG: S8 family serine peptidase [Candidatus Peribacteraceae bacterium]|nr:S8 family serine peptidase [Candidatus Peribacteraceae bacterium]
MRRVTIVLACLSLILLPLLTRAEGGDLSQPDGGRLRAKKIKNQYIVMLKDDADVDTDSDYIVKKRKGMLVFKFKHSFKGFVATMSDQEAATLKDDPKVADVVQDEEMYIDAKRDGDVTAQAQILPTGVNRVNAESKTNKGTNVEVAILDTGIDSGHPDLKSAVLGGISCIKGEAALQDGNGHGTHVAGIVGARNNTIGGVGVGPEIRLWSVKVLNRQGSGTWSSVICGIDWVKSQASHIKVANLSLGGTGSAGVDCNASPLRKAICNAVNAGVTFVVAAGNESDDVKNHVPAAFPETIAVSALADSNGTACGGGASTTYGADDTFATFSNFATLPADKARLIGAPGVSIYSTWKNNTYSTISGTSMAAPHVAGAAALYIKANPGKTPAQVKAALLAAAEPGNVNFKTECPTGKNSHAGTVTHPEGVLRAEGL